MIAPEPADQTCADVAPSEADVQAVAEILQDLPTDPHHYARLLLASDWFAARDAEHAAEVEALRREVGRTRAFNLRTEEDKGRHWRTLRDRCAAAEATVARVRALAEKFDAEPYGAHAFHGFVVAHDLHAALDGGR